MSNQCRNCGRDVNNNYTPYSNGYGNRNSAKSDLSKTANAQNVATSASASTSTTIASNQITAKVMFGTVDAINELREKEHAEKNSAARAGRRQ